MKTSIKKITMLFCALLIFAVFNYAIYQKEQIKAHGEIVLLELEPVDPRSLIQGDYMRLLYAIENAPVQAKQKRGYLVVRLDTNKVATFKRFYEGEPLAPEERLLHYHRKYSGIQIVPNSFMFQEGHAGLYERAKYGVFRFSNKDSRILVGLADDKFQMIQPSE